MTRRNAQAQSSDSRQGLHAPLTTISARWGFVARPSGFEPETFGSVDLGWSSAEFVYVRPVALGSDSQRPGRSGECVSHPWRALPLCCSTRSRGAVGLFPRPRGFEGFLVRLEPAEAQALRPFRPTPSLKA